MIGIVQNNMQTPQCAFSLTLMWFQWIFRQEEGMAKNNNANKLKRDNFDISIELAIPIVYKYNV